MIIKSLSRKTVSFGQVLEYIGKPPEKGLPLLHNLRSGPDDTAGVHKEFLHNARYLPRRKGGNVLYHEVMSFHGADRDQVSPRVIEDLVRRYLELRAPRAIAYARAHHDTAHVHVHILISANDLAAAKRLRLTKSHFKRVVHQVEQYQVRQYPFLRESVAFDRDFVRENGRREGRKKTVPMKKTRVERERDFRVKRQGRGGASRKELLADQVLDHIKTADSARQFLDRLYSDGFELYVNGKRTGIKNMTNGVKHRFETLGVNEQLETALRRWKVITSRLQAIDQVEREKVRRAVLERGYRDGMAGVLGLGGEGLSTQERERLVAIGRIQQERRQREGRGRAR